jgi:ribosomal protein S8
MTDPIADMLTRLRNASAAKHETVDMPYSKFKANIAQILKREGFITDFSSKEAKVGQTLELTLSMEHTESRAFRASSVSRSLVCVATRSLIRCQCLLEVLVSLLSRPARDC